MNPFLLPPTDRLDAWRDFRKSLDGQAEEVQLTMVVEWFAETPISTFVLDFDHPETWPGPWEVMNEGNFCSTAIAYMMQQTLQLVGWDQSRFEFRYIRNNKIEDQMMVLLIDDKWALNYGYRQVVDFEPERADCLTMVSYRFNARGGFTPIS